MNNLDFVNELELPNIKQFWVKNNNLHSFEALGKYKTLQIIEFSNNKINSLDNLDSFVKNFENLKRINLKGNNINQTLISKSIIESLGKKNIEILTNPYFN